MLTSRSTRIDGLVSIADIAPSVVALEKGRRPTIRSRVSRDAPTARARLDARLRHAHDARTTAIVVLVASVLTLAGFALLLRSASLSRAALLAIPAALTVSFALSAARIDGLLPVALLLSIGTVGLSVLGGRSPRALLPLLLAFLVAAVAALALWPAVGALSVIGPHPDGGGRYFGVTNEVETLLLAPILAVGALVGTRFGCRWSPRSRSSSSVGAALEQMVVACLSSSPRSLRSGASAKTRGGRLVASLPEPSPRSGSGCSWSASMS